MILGVDELLKLIKKQKLVENLSERELANPEGAMFDLRIGEIYKISGNGFLGIDKRETPKEKLVAKYDPKKKTAFTFKPGDYFLMKTIESVNMPDDLVAFFRPRTTLFRSGLTLYTGTCAPGYCGELIFAIHNAGKCKVKIELGSRVVNISFFKVKGKVNLYRGQWKGGRVATKVREKQV
jgi:deoxycytidine triphosphate deaminase